MEPELWAELSAAISAVQRQVTFNPRDTHPTARIVRVHLWAVLHDRPTSWGCDPRHWTDRTRPAAALPDQSTMSRRTRRKDFGAFLELLGRRLNGGGGGLVRVVDGKPLELPNHTSDRDAAWGRGVSRTSVGYKLHAVWRAGAAMPDAFAITPLDACEKRMAFRLAKRLGGGAGGDLGYLLGDAHYDASWLFDACRGYGLRLVCPRPKPGTGLGHHYQSPGRLRSIDLLEPPPANVSDAFGPSLYRLRPGIEREFSGAVTFGGGLQGLPSWVRRIWRVRNWVWAKLLVNAARVRVRKRTCAA